MHSLHLGAHAFKFWDFIINLCLLNMCVSASVCEWEASLSSSSSTSSWRVMEHAAVAAKSRELQAS